MSCVSVVTTGYVECSVGNLTLSLNNKFWRKKASTYHGTTKSKVQNRNGQIKVTVYLNKTKIEALIIFFAFYIQYTDCKFQNKYVSLFQKVTVKFIFKLESY